MGNPETYPPPFLFLKGTEVEVTRDENSSKMVWHRATILETTPKSTSKKRRKPLVEYKFRSTQNNSTTFTEYIDPAYVRPLPPNQDTAVGFEECDPVEARYKDGWWTGVVKNVLESSRYMVYFDNPPDVVELEREDLRPHLEWVNGDWFPKEKQQPREFKGTQTGRAVEININEKNLCDVWFPAIVIKENEDHTFLVKYPRLSKIDDNQAIKVTVDSHHIRPPPPNYMDRDYELLERVDTTYNGGWCAGVIIKVLTGRRYIVFFTDANEGKEFSHSQIRPHVEWYNGIWVRNPSNPKEHLITPNGQGQLQHANNDSNNRDVAGKLESIVKGKRKAEEKTPFSTSTRKTPMDESISWDKNYELRSRKKKLKLESYNVEMESNPFKEFSEGKSAEDPLFLTSGNLGDFSSESTEESQSGLTTSRRRGSRFRSVRKLSTRCSSSSKIERLSRTTTDKEPNTSVLRARSKCLPHSQTGGQSSKGNACPTEINVDDGKPKDSYVSSIFDLKSKTMGAEVGNSEIPSNELLKLMREKETWNASEPKELISGGSTQRRKRGRPRKLIILNSNPLHSVPQETCGEKTAETLKSADDSIGEEVDLINAEVPINEACDDPALSKFQSACDEKPRLCSHQTVNGFNDSISGSGLGSFHNDDNKSGGFPFVKRSPIWETIESMEIFKLIPQSPHFFPLHETKSIEEYREGSAIGIMVTYAGLLEKITLLQLSDPKPIFHDILETLDDLEKHGFDVTAPRDRMTKLSMLKGDGDDDDEQVMTQSESSDLEMKIKEHIIDRTKLDEKAEEMRRKIVGLEEQYATTISKREVSDLEIAEMKSRVDDFNAKTCVFRQTATAPWKLLP